MSLYSAEFQAALDRGENPLTFFYVVWPTLVGGAKAYTFGAPAGKFGAAPGIPALADPRVIECSQITRRLGMTPGNVAFPDFSVTLADTDGTITKIVDGPVDVRRSFATATWHMPSGTSPSLSHTHMAGFVDRVERDRHGKAITYFVRANDAPLEGSFPRAQILRAEAPLANSVNPPWGAYWPIVYGTHDAQALSGKGMIPTINWAYDGASSQWRYGVALGRMKAVNRVYKDGTQQTLSTHYAISYPIVGGKQITSIDFTSAPGTGAVITCDVDGYEHVGDGSGGVLLNPVQQILHLLTNWAYSDYRLGLWLQSSGALHYQSFAVSAEFSGSQNYEGSMRFGGDTKQQRLVDICNRWLISWPAFRFTWTENAGQIACVVFGNHRWPGYIDAPFFRDHQLTAVPMPKPDTSLLANRIDGSYLYGAADGKFWSALAVQDLSQPEQVARSLQLDYSASRLI